MSLSVPLKAHLHRDLFLENHKPIVIHDLMAVPNANLPLDIAILIASYVLSNKSVFGAEEWIKYFGVDVVDPEPISDFYQFWWGLDPIDRSKQVCETHIPPVLRPRVVKAIGTQVVETYNLKVLSRLIENPRAGCPSRYAVGGNLLRSKIFDPSNWNKPLVDKPICWIIMREDVIGRDKKYPDIQKDVENLNNRTQIGYETSYRAIDISTVVLTQHVVSGIHYLGTDTGMEGRFTFAYVQESYSFGRMSKGASGIVRARVGAFTDVIIDSEGIRSNGLLISSTRSYHTTIGLSDFGNPNTGFALLKKFDKKQPDQERSCWFMRLFAGFDGF